MLHPAVHLQVTLRTLELDGEPWFHATDVCRCVGLNTSKGTFLHTKRLAGDERRLIQTPAQNRGPGKAPSFTAVSESGLYKLIMRSDKAEAREFIRFHNSSSARLP